MHSDYSWPFFDDEHRRLARELRPWASTHAGHPEHADDSPEGVGRQARALVQNLGEAGWLRYVVPAAHGGVRDALDVRSIAIARETLAFESGLADFAFAMQGLGSAPISQFGSQRLKDAYLPNVRDGKAVAAFAISEREAGSDISAMRTTAKAEGDAWVLNGEKTWISNAGIADHYVVFTRLTGEGDKAFGAFVVDARTPGLHVSELIPVSAPHPLGSLTFTDCRVDGWRMIGERGKGLSVALGTLDLFRSTVAAAALGFARRALHESLAWVRTRKAFGQELSTFQLTQARLADMATAIDASALLIYRAAWAKDTGAPRITREAAMAKMFATESAQKVVDDAVQLFGGRGVVSGEVVERLYREVRALRIYEGTSEILKLVIAGQVLKDSAERKA